VYEQLMAMIEGAHQALDHLSEKVVNVSKPNQVIYVSSKGPPPDIQRTAVEAAARLGKIQLEIRRCLDMPWGILAPTPDAVP
jgi:hypothetical protein